MPDDFKPFQFAVRYPNPHAADNALTIGPWDREGAAYDMALLLREQGHEPTIVVREITRWMPSEMQLEPVDE